MEPFELTFLHHIITISAGLYHSHLHEHQMHTIISLQFILDLIFLFSSSGHDTYIH